MNSYPPILFPADFAAGTGGMIAADDPRVQPLLGGITAAVRNYCRWHVTPVVDAEVVLDGRGGPVLRLPTLRVEGITAVTAAGTEYTAGEQYDWSADGVLKRRRGCWPERYRSVSVSFRHGFNVTDVADLVQVIQQVGARAIASPMGAIREAVGPFSFQASQVAPGVSGGVALMAHERAVLDAYRLPGVA